MALTTSYDGLLSRIRLAATGLSGSATYAVFDRSDNEFLSSTIVRGGSRVSVSGGAADLDDYEFPAGVAIEYRVRAYDNSDVLLTTFTVGPLLQDLENDWLKVPAAPYMNRPIIITEAGDRRRPARNQIFPIVGRNFDVAVSDVRPSMSFDVKLKTFDWIEERDMDFILASGEILFIQLPSTNKCMPEGYYCVGDVSCGPSGSRAKPGRIFNLPLTQVAPPGPDVVGSTYTWASVLADYATWGALMAVNLTWGELLQHTGNPGDIIVP